MTLLKKNSERNAKEEKEARDEIINVYQLVSHVSYWGTLFNAPLLKIAIKSIDILSFCIIFVKFAHRTPNFIQNDLEQWIILTITA